MQQDLRGELTYSAYSVIYPEKHDSEYQVKAAHGGQKREPEFDGNQIEGYDIDPSLIEKAIVRIKGVRLVNERNQKDVTLSAAVYLNSSGLFLDRSIICNFELQLKYDEKEGVHKEMSINIEATEKVRNAALPGIREVSIQMRSTSGHEFCFERLQLTIFTRNE
jgi:hypothetical protein